MLLPTILATSTGISQAARDTGVLRAKNAMRPGAFEDYLRALSIRHIYCAPRHPQTNGKLEQFHETLKDPAEPARLHELGGPPGGNGGLHPVLQPRALL